MIEDSNVLNTIEGLLTINSESYSVRELVQSLVSQGISVKKVGSNLRVGNKLIPSTIEKSSAIQPNIHPSISNGLEIQLTRIVSEITKLKRQVNLLENNDQNGSNSKFGQFLDPTSDKEYENNTSDNYKTWDLTKGANNSRISSKINPREVPIITLGKKSKNQALALKFQEMTNKEGLSEEKALDKLSTKIYDNTNKIIDKASARQSNISTLNQESQEINSISNKNGRCSCGMVIPTSALFCARCGKKVTM